MSKMAEENLETQQRETFIFPTIKKIETMSDCIEQIEMREYECIGGYLKNNNEFIKLKELVKKTTPESSINGKRHI